MKLMKKARILLVMMLLLASQGTFAQKISYTEALEVVRAFVDNAKPSLPVSNHRPRIMYNMDFQIYPTAIITDYSISDVDYRDMIAPFTGLESSEFSNEDAFEVMCKQFDIRFMSSFLKSNPYVEEGFNAVGDLHFENNVYNSDKTKLIRSYEFNLKDIYNFRKMQEDNLTFNEIIELYMSELSFNKGFFSTTKKSQETELGLALPSFIEDKHITSVFVVEKETFDALKSLNEENHKNSILTIWEDLSRTSPLLLRMFKYLGYDMVRTYTMKDAYINADHSFSIKISGQEFIEYMSSKGIK